MKKYILSCAMLLVTTTVGAQPPVPRHEWSPQTHLWLARAMVAEAGWKAERDHVAIAYVLVRRWRRMTQRLSRFRFVDVIRNYCAGLGDYRRSMTPRQRWVRDLWADAVEPEGWPRSRASWKNHAPLWRATLERSARWGRGELSDPCRGKAWHWGGVIDSPRGRMVAVDCGRTRNTFYRLEPR